MGQQQKYPTPFHYFISFFPTAPLFGVQWRFESMMPGASLFRSGGASDDATQAGARAAGKAFDQAAHATEDAFGKAASAVDEMTIQAELIIESFAREPDLEAFIDEEDDYGEDAEDAEIVVAPKRPASLLDTRPAMVNDLKQIKGVGPKLEEQLNTLGIYTFAQIAQFSADDLAWIDEHLGTFRGRPLRDDWVAQARAML
jgi:NADH-quinone oxidoreductase subunit E